MRLTLNLQNLLPMFSLETAAKLTAEAGFDATDFYLGAMTDPECVFNTDKWQDHAAECRDVFFNSETPIIQTHAPFSFKGWDDRITFEEFIYPTIVRSIQQRLHGCLSGCWTCWPAFR